MAARDPGGVFEELRRLDAGARQERLARLREEDPELAHDLRLLLAVAHAAEVSADDATEPSPAAADAGFAAEVLRRLQNRGADGDRYRRIEEVARGGQGAVLKVYDEDMRRSLAMKVILGHASAEGQTTEETDPRTLGRFLEEAQVTGQLDHPGIVPVHELGLDPDGRPFFTMKLVKGRDLRAIFELLRDGAEGWSRTRALGVLLKVCEAMAYAHAKGVVHRDLKPANVMVGNYGEVYVMDWGLARVLGRGDSKDVRIQPRSSTTQVRSGRHADASDTDSPLVTMDGDVVGTPAYMSPEQALGQLEELGPQTDVYSAGAMLYELLSGQKPYVSPGMRLNNYAIWYQVQKGPPDPLQSVAPDAPPELTAICEKAMQREPERRYRDMSELAEDLRAFLEHRVVHAYETGSVAELRKWVERNRGLAASIAAAVLLAIGGLGSVSYVQAGRTRLAIEKAEEGRRVTRLSAFRTLAALEDRARELWPARPENQEVFLAWLADAEELIAGLEDDPETGTPGHRQQLAALRARALPRTGEADEWRFAEDLDRWWHDQLTELVAAIEAFAHPETGLIDGFSSEFGWGIARRLELASTIADRSLNDPNVRRRWSVARQEIAAHPAYGGLDLPPQLGLVPIGTDPDSGLWEFWDVQTGVEPGRDAAGRVVMSERAGLVFVLLPGGSFWMGAQAEDPSGRNHDPEAKPDEAPVHRVTLSPFFLSKYEMTQGQWQRVCRSNPSSYGPAQHRADRNARGEPFDLRYPVESVSWEESTEVLARLGLTLPTEAQWEYAARGGRGSVWWTGDDPTSLAGACNLADAFALASDEVVSWKCEEWSDGFVFQAPVGSFRPNPFGLHDLLGNVYEWCLDGYDAAAYGDGAPRVDPLVDPESRPERAGRGADYQDDAKLARSAKRGGGSPDYRSPRTGLRPSRPLER